MLRISIKDNALTPLGPMWQPTGAEARHRSIRTWKLQCIVVTHCPLHIPTFPCNSALNFEAISPVPSWICSDVWAVGLERPQREKATRQNLAGCHQPAEHY